MSKNILEHLTESVATDCATRLARGYYHEGTSRGVLNISLFFKQIIKSLGYNLEPSPSLGRIDLPSGNVISLDFVLTTKREGEGTSGVHLGSTKENGDSIHLGVWGNKWVISMSALTMSGERHLIQTFSLTQPMLSRYNQHCSTDTVEKRHIELVERHLNQGVKKMSSFLTHYLNRIIN
mgnify:CR=1 FL=1